MVFLVRGWSTESIEGKKKTDRRKTLKSEEKEKRRIRGKSNNNNIHLWFWIIFCSTYFGKKVAYIINFIYSFYALQDIWNKVMIHQIWKYKCTNYNIIEIYINRLSATTQIFIAIDYLIMMSEKYLYFRKRKKTFGKDIFYPPHRSNWIHVRWKYFLNYVFTRDIYRYGIIQNVSKLIIFLNLWVLNFTAVWTKKMKQWNLDYSFCLRSLLLVQNIFWFTFFEERW